MIDDRGARHPLTLEPLITATSVTQFESDLAEVFLGGSVVPASDVNDDVHADEMAGAEACDHPRGV